MKDIRKDNRPYGWTVATVDTAFTTKVVENGHGGKNPLPVVELGNGFELIAWVPPREALEAWLESPHILQLVTSADGSLSMSIVPVELTETEKTETTVSEFERALNGAGFDAVRLDKSSERDGAIWDCKIGIAPGTSVRLPGGADEPMREAVERAYKDVTGLDAEFCFSGWGADLTDDETKVLKGD